MTLPKKIFSNDGKPMLSARKVAARLKCAPDYVSKLCREGKLKGEQINGQWFVVPSSIDEFEALRAVAKEQRSAQLAQQRREEQALFQNRHSTQRVAARLKCAPDYVSKLCREGKLKGEQINGQWFVDASSIDEFEALRVVAKEQRSAQLAQQRREEQALFQTQNSTLIEQIFFRLKEISVGAPIGMVVGTAFLFVALVFAGSAHLPKQNQYAALSESQTPFFGTQIPSLTFPVKGSNVFASATNFFSNTIGLLFGGSNKIASNTSNGLIEPVKTSTVSSSTPATVAVIPQTKTQIVNNYPVVERVIERPVVSDAGVTEAQLNSGLENLYNRLAVQISFLQNPGHESPLQNFAISQVINNLSDVRLNGFTVADDISANTLSVGRLNVSGNAHVSGTFSAGTTTVSNLAVTSIASAILKTDADGNLVPAVAGVDYVTGSAVSATYPFALAGNATSTLTQFNGGLTAFASSTIGDGTQFGGLTISGGATTTGNAYFGSALAVLGDTTLANATSSAFAITGIASGSILKTTTGGAIIPAVAGVDYLTSANVFEWPFTPSAYGVSTSTTVGFTQGLLSTASSTFTGTLTLSAITNGLLATNASGQLVATTTLATNYLSGILGTINGTAFNAGSSIIITAASSTLLADNNTFSGNTILTNATSSTFAITSVISSLLKTDTNGNVVPAVAGTDYITGSGLTAAYPFPNNATSTFLTFAGGLSTTNASTTNLSANTFAAGQTGTTSIAANGALTTPGLTVSGNTATLLSTNGSGLVQNTTVSGPLSFSGSTLSISQANGSTNGYLSSSDWNLFNEKVSSSSLLSVVASAYPFQGAGNATSTLTQFNAGLTAFASSTIGNGTQSGGLTISGGATTTGNAFVGGVLTVRQDVNDTAPTLLKLINLGGGASTGGTLEFPYSAYIKSQYANGFEIRATDGTNLTMGGNSLVFGGNTLRLGATGPATIKSDATSGNPLTIISPGNLVFQTYDNSLGFLDRVTLTQAGNFGIGTTSASQALAVQGNQYTSGSAFFGGAITATSTLTVSGLSAFANASTTLATFSGSTWFTSLPSSLLATDAAGKLVATTTLATNYLSGILGTINGTAFNAGSSITITAASSTLLADNNTFSGNTTLANATSSAFFATTASSTNLFAQTGSIGTLAAQTLTISGNTATLLSTNGSGLVQNTTVSGPLSFSGSTLSISQANSSTNGYLSSSDYSIFSAKLSSTSLQSSALLATLLSDETGTGSVVFSNSPTFTGTAAFANTTNSGTLSVTGLSNLGGFISTASSTIVGSLTTTGSGQFASLGVGVATTAPGVIETTGNVFVGGGLTVAGSFSSSITNGQIQFLATPIGTGIGQGSVFVNPASAGTNNVLFGIAVNGSERARIDAEGDVQIVGTFNSTNVSGTNSLAGNLTVDGNTVLGVNASSTVALNGRISTDIIPNADLAYSLGSPTYRFSNIYAGTTTIANLVAGGTASSTFIINSGNATADAEDASLEFSRGSQVPNAALKWNSTLKQFEFNNFPVNIANTLTVSGTATSSIAGNLALTATPTGTGLSQGSLFINPSSGSTDNTLLGIGVNSVERFRIDAEGDTFVGGSLGVQNAIYDISDSTLIVDDILQINGNAIKDSAGTTRLTLGATNVFTGNLDIGSGTLTSGLINGQNISANANFTGTLTVNGNTTLANATSSAFAITGIASGSILKTTTGGAIIPAVANTDYITPAFLSTSIASAYPFQGAGNATSTLTQFNGGLTAFASSTIGNGTQTGGLTISGGATTTGNAYFGGALTVSGNTTFASSLSGLAQLTNGALSAVTGTTGQVPYFSATNAVTATSSLYISAAGNVGVNSISSNAKFTIGGIAINTYESASTTTSAPQGNVMRLDASGNGDSNYIGTYFAGNNAAGTTQGAYMGAFTNTSGRAMSIVFGQRTNALQYAERMRIDASGNVGIGTTTPAATLGVAGSIYTTLSVTAGDGKVVLGTDSNGEIELKGTTAGTSNPYFDFGDTRTKDFDWRLQESSASNRFSIFSSTTSNVLNILGNGNVGIGTTTPLAKLNVQNSNDSSSILLVSGLTKGVRLGASTVGGLIEGVDYSGTGSYQPLFVGGSYVSLTNSNTEVMRLTGGNVGIGTTTPSATLALQGNQYISGTAFFGGAVTATSTLTVSGNTTLANATSSAFAISGIASGSILKTTTGGAIIPAVAGTDYVTGSTLTASYPFTLAGNATSTLTQFNGGLTAFASSTIGNGTATGGLTVSGNATTTGTAYFAGNVGLGTSSPFAKLAIAGGNIYQTAGTPVLVGSGDQANAGRGVAVFGRYAFVVNSVANSNGLEIFDISNPYSPVRITQFSGASAAAYRTPVVSGNYLYLPKISNTGGDSLRILDISNIKNPVTVSTVNIAFGVYALGLSGKYMYASGPTDLYVYDVSNPASPALLGSVALPNVSQVNSLAVQGPYVYLAEATSTVAAAGLHVVDVSNPAAPLIVGTYAAKNPVSSVTVSGSYAYLGEQSSSTGVEIVDISNPASPTLASTFATGCAANADGGPIALAGRYLYFVCGSASNNFQVIDVSSPTNPVSSGAVTIGSNIGVAVQGKYAYVSGNTTTGGFRVVDISGVDTPSITAGAIATELFTANLDARIGGNLYTNGGITAGLQGIFSRGGLGVYVSSSTAANPVAATFMGGNVGIGTTSPTYKLSVEGISSLGNQAIAGYFTATSTTASSFAGGLTAFASSTIGNGTATGGLTINGGATTTGNAYFAGNVGIGTSSPFAKLAVQQTTVGSSGLVVQGFANNTVPVFQVIGGGSPNTRLMSVINFAGTEVFTVTQSSVGIGTTTPTRILDVVSSSAATNVRFQTISQTQPDVLTLENVGNQAADRGAGLLFNVPQSTGSTANGGRIYVGEEGSVTTSYMAFQTGISGTLTERMRITSSGNVGVGTANPQALLHLNAATVLGSSVGATATTTTQQWNVGNSAYLDTFSYRHTAGSNWTGANIRIQKTVDVTKHGFIDFGIDGRASNSGLGFGSGTNTYMVVDSNGNVGIGTTTPQSKLSVVSGTNGTLNFPSGNWAAQIYNQDDAAVSGGLVVGNRWYANTSTVLDVGSLYGTGSAWQSFFTVKGNGNVGIGTTSPTYKLSVEGSSTLGNQAIAGYFTATSTTASTFPYASTTALTVSGNAYFPGSGIWNSSGRLGIGTTTPGAPLDVFSSANSSVRISSNSGASSLDLIADYDNNGTTESGLVRYFTGSLTAAAATGFSKSLNGYGIDMGSSVLSAPEFFVSAAGNIGIGTTTPQTSFVVNGGSLLSSSNNFGSATFGSNGSSAGVSLGSYTAGYGAIQGTSAYGNSAAYLLINPNGGSLGFGAIGALGSPSGNAFSSGVGIGSSYWTTSKPTNGLLVEGNVGIGTTSPTYKLSVEGSSTLGNQAIAGYFTATSTTASSFAGGLTAFASSTIGNGTLGLTVNGSATTTGTAYFAGNVGIGTSTPAAPLQVWGTSAVFGSRSSLGAANAFNFVAASSTLTDTAGGDLTFSASNGMGAGGSGNILFTTASAQTSTIVLDATSTTSGTPNTITWSHTVGSCPNNDGILIIAASDQKAGAKTVSSLLSGPMTALQGGSGGGLHIYYVLNPVAGADTLSYGSTGSTAQTALVGMTYCGVNQTNPFGTKVVTSGTGTSVASSTQGGQILLDFLYKNNTDVPTQNAGQTLVARRQAGTSVTMDVSSAPNSQSAMGWTWSTSSNYAHAAVPLLSKNATTTNSLAERLRINADGKVGIGTTTPWGALSVTNSSASTPSFVVANSSNTPQFLVDGNGNVGLGTTSPVSRLAVEGNLFAGAITATSTLTVSGLSTFTNGFLSLASSTIGNGTATGGLTVFGNATTTGNAYFAGNVGIGTTTPYGMLSVYGDAGAQGPVFNPSFIANVANEYGSTIGGVSVASVARNAIGQQIDSVSALGNGYTAIGQLITRITAPGNGRAYGLVVDTVSNTSGAQNVDAVGGYFANITGNSNGNASGLSIGAVTYSGSNGSSYASGLQIANSITNTNTAANAYAINSLSTAKSYFAGNVGIGTTTPLAKLNVQNSNDSSSILLVSGLTKGVRLGASTVGGLIEGVDYSGTGSYQPLFVGGSYVSLTNSNTEVMRLTGGNVGIGTTSPVTPLHVYSTADNIATFGGADHSLVFIEGTSGFERSLNFTTNGAVGVEWKIGMDNVPAADAAKFSIKRTNNANAEFVIDTAGNVGIGTTSPTYKLSVEGISSLGNQAIAGYFTATSTTASSFAGGFTSFASTTIGNGTQAGGLTINGGATTTGNAYFAGNVGIGTAAPGGKLDIVTAHSQGTTQEMFRTAFDTNWGLRIVQNYVGAGDIKYEFKQESAGTEYDVLTFKVGNVGIGTTTPTEKFAVASALGGTTNTGIFSLYNTSTPGTGAGAGIQLYAKDDTGARKEQARITSYLTNGAPGSYASDLQFFTSTTGSVTEKMRITSSGNVGIGTTTPAATLGVAGSIYTTLSVTAGDGKVVLGTDSNGEIELKGTTAGTSNPYFDFGDTRTKDFDWRLQESSASNRFSIFSSTTSNVLNILGNGNVGIGTTSPTSVLEVAQQAVGTRGVSIFGFANNQVPALQVTGGASPNSAIFNIQTTSGNPVLTAMGLNTVGVGVGTSTPWGNLSVTGSGSVPNFVVANSSNAPQFVVTSTGNVGVGTANPQALLHLSVTSALGSGVGATATSSQQQWNVGNVAYIDTFIRRHTAGSNWVGTNIRMQKTIDVTKMGFIDFGIDGVSGDSGLGFGSGATTNLVITSAGNVGIGTTTPIALLDVGTFNTSNANIRTGSLELQSYALNNSFIGENVYYDGSKFAYRRTGAAGLFVFGGTEGGFRWSASGTAGGNAGMSTYQLKTASDGTFAVGPSVSGSSGSYTGATFLVNSAGSVGIGTTTLTWNTVPTRVSILGAKNTSNSAGGGGDQLAVIDSSTAAQGVGGAINLFGNYTGTTQALGAMIDTYKSNGTAGNFSFDLRFHTRVNGTALIQERMRITDTGNVGIGTTTPQSKLSVVSGTNGTLNFPSGNWAAQIYNQDDAAVSGGLVVGNRWYANTSTVLDVGSLYGTGSAWQSFFTVKGNGNVGIGTTSPTYKLSVEGSSTLGNQAIAGYFTATSTTASSFAGGLTAFASSTIGNGTLGLTVNGSATTTGTAYFAGKIGIGTTTPVSTLTVVGSGCFSVGAGATTACGTTPGNIYYTAANTGNYDVAERYATNDASLAAGDVVALDPENPLYIQKAKAGARALGIVSSNPGLILGGADALAASTTKAVALSGRVPVKVNLEGGDIAIGDSIVLSSQDGVATKATSATYRLGVALQPWNAQMATTSTGVIEVFIQSDLYVSDMALETLSSVGTTTAQILAASSTDSVVAGFSSTLNSAVSALGGVVVRAFNGVISATIGIFNKVYAKELHTDQLCISDGSGETCITKAQLDSLLSGAAASQGNGGGTNTGGSNSGGGGEGNATTTDTVAPTVTLIGNNPATIAIGAVYSDLGATVSDDVDSNLGFKVSLDGGELMDVSALTLDTSTSTTYTILFSATDSAGNVGTATRTVIVE